MLGHTPLASSRKAIKLGPGNSDANYNWRQSPALAEHHKLWIQPSYSFVGDVFQFRNSIHF
jgi:hypothetical protein